MKHIPSEAVQNIHNQNSFFQFFKDHLGWKIQDDISFDELTYGWSPEEMDLKSDDLRGSRISQLRPFTHDQPWGIFFIHLAKPQVYVTQLRKLIRALAPMKRKHKDYPTWNPHNLLFICTPDWKNYTFAHFEDGKPEKAKLSTFGWEYQSSYIRTLCEFNLKALQMPEVDMFSISPKLWLDEWSKAFDVKSVTDKFFQELRDTFRDIQSYITNLSEENKRSFAQLLLNRLLFLKFLEKKGWLFVEDSDSLELRRSYLARQREKLGQQNQWQYFFKYLFFHGLNRPWMKGSVGTVEETDAIRKIIGRVPYLNGGLFERSHEWDDEKVKVENEAFDMIFDKLLDRYNFTIQENTPIDIEVALNPDLLGYAYEELIAERHGQGAFYTHPTEVGLMCRESLKTFLEEHTQVLHSSIADLVDGWNAKNLSEEQAFAIYRLIHNIKILDPAVGSGAYPVRMMQELVQIYKALASKLNEGQLRYIFENKLANPRSIFELKLNIIQNNLYGVDIDQFAVEIAKLRFWLSLVVDYRRGDGKEEDIKSPEELKLIPALPNLDFKLRVGDSLVASAGVGKKGLKEKGQAFNLDIRLSDHAPDLFVADKIPELIKLKEKFFNFEELRKNDAALVSISKEELRHRIAEKENEISQALGFVKVENIDTLPHILWQIHFAEIYDVGRVADSTSGLLGESSYRYGFDICIANPPYLRQEKINELFNTFNIGLTKDDLVETYEALYKNQNLKINKKSDLYVYFYLRGINLLKEKGVLCFICSNSWLDVGYGAKLQEFLLRNSRIKAVYDNSAKRSFEKADVNTTINVFVKDSTVEKKTVISTTAGSKVEVSSENVVRFVNFRKPFELAAISDTLQQIERATAITSTDDYRVYPIKQKDLWKAGIETKEETVIARSPEGTTKQSDSSSKGQIASSRQSGIRNDVIAEYTGDKWGGKYLRAPDIFFTILEKGKGKLVRLGDIAEVRRGFTTGANEFFYLDDAKIAEWQIEKEFLKPVIKSPRECKSILIDPKQLKYKIFMCHEEKKELKGTKALKYIEWGEEQGFNERPSCSGRQRWYDLGKQDQHHFVMLRFRDKRNWTPVLPVKIYVGDIMFVGKVLDENDLEINLALLNSTLHIFSTELFGRVNLGDGLLTTYGPEIPKFLLLDKTGIANQKNFLKAFDQIKNRPVKTFYEECGLKGDKEIRSQQPNPLPDRKALDDVVFDALGLTEAERKEVYWAVCELVQNRLRKAKSV
ncbi:MAG: Eco57I restriction-modification methylase domain-containing protein [Bacteroidota bacterium]|nr:Eco57I restriction-modification methylase domain-containing protein [Bacteroidota bacterium]